MNKIISSCLFFYLLFSNISFAQYFGVEGSTWHYSKVNVADFMPGSLYESYMQVTSSGDTTIHGKVCNRLVNSSPLMCSGEQGTKFTYYANDSVFYYEPAYDSFELLYDMNASQGESWYIRIPDYNDEDTISVHVNFTDTVTINGLQLKRLQVSYNTHFDNMTPFSYDSEIIERIGDTHYLFNLFPEWSYACDEAIVTGMRCYEDPNMPLYATAIANSCTFQSYIGLDEQQFTQRMAYPNPASNAVHLSIENGTDVTYEIFDLLGNLVVKGQTYSEIDISSLVSGSYILMVQDKGTLRTSKMQVVK
jgi:hypothetical protein